MTGGAGRFWGVGRDAREEGGNDLLDVPVVAVSHEEHDAQRGAARRGGAGGDVEESEHSGAIPVGGGVCEKGLRERREPSSAVMGSYLCVCSAMARVCLDCVGHIG